MLFIQVTVCWGGTESLLYAHKLFVVTYEQMSMFFICK